MRSVRHIRGAAALSLLLAGAAANANEIRYQFLGLAAVVVGDNAAGDLDPAVNRIRTNFDISRDAGAFSWRARGTLVGIADPPFSTEATTRLMNLIVENTEGNVGGQLFTFSHRFGQLGPPMPGTSFDLRGRFDNITDPGWLGGARGEFWSYVQGLAGTTLIGSGDTGHVEGAAPIKFHYDGDPVAIVHPNKHIGNVIFYLDSEGDSLFMRNGELWTIRSTAVIPAPASFLLLGLAGLGMVRRCRAG